VIEFSLDGTLHAADLPPDHRGWIIGTDTIPAACPSAAITPVEYWHEDDPVEPSPFDRAEVDAKLAG
jgi:hypothetical protein